MQWNKKVMLILMPVLLVACVHTTQTASPGILITDGAGFAQTAGTSAPLTGQHKGITILEGKTPRTALIYIPSNYSPAKAAPLMFLNYPNNPTGATATLDFFRRAVDFARRHDVLVAQDAAYNELYFADERPPSILQVPGVSEVAVEFHSASKTFNMTGWRIGFVVGNADVIAALAAVKANVDTGVFAAVQEAACVAYANLDRPELHASRRMYPERAALFCEALRGLGFTAEPPTATFYVWARVPAGHNSAAVCDRLLEQANIVGVPGSSFGPAGEGYVRFSLSVPTERIRAAAARMKGLKW